MVELPQQFLDLLELLLCLLDGLLTVGKTFVFARLMFRACLILHSSKMLDLLAGVFHLGKAQRCRGSFEKVAESRQLIQVPLVAAQYVSVMCCQRN